MTASNSYATLTETVDRLRVLESQTVETEVIDPMTGERQLASIPAFLFRGRAASLPIHLF